MSNNEDAAGFYNIIIFGRCPKILLFVLRVIIIPCIQNSVDMGEGER
jgi:hypothetical protein